LYDDDPPLDEKLVLADDTPRTVLSQPH